MAKTPSYEELENEITRLKSVISSLEASEQHYRRMTDNISDTIWQIDLDTMKFSYVNPSYNHISGFTDQEIKNSRLEDLFTPESFKMIVDALSEELIAEEAGAAKPRLLELEHLHKNGSIFWAEISARFVRDREGRPYAITGVTRDISKRKEIETALMDSEKRYRSFVENFQGIAYRGDFNESWKPLFFHGSVEEITGFQPEEFITGTKNWTDIIHPDDLSGLERQNDVISIPGYKARREYRIRHNNGEIRWVREYMQNTCNNKGNIESIEGIIYDITELKEIEEALKEKELLLEEEAEHLKAINAALNVLLDKREEDKHNIEDNIVKNIRTLIEPYIFKLKNTKLQQNQKTLTTILENNLNDIISPFSKRLSSKLVNLSPTEIQVANLIKLDKTNKEIAEILGVAKRTIEFHRENIRTKFDLKNKKINLKTYLMSIK